MCLALDQTLDSGTRLRVLHVAPEPAVRALLAGRPDVEYVSIDLYSREAMLTMDITQLEFSDETFDLALCSHVLEHVTQDAAALSEIHRVLRPGGTALIQVPVDTRRSETFEDPTVTDAVRRLEVFGQADHVRIYGSDIVGRIRQAGFDVAEHRTPPDTVRRFGLAVPGPVDGETLYVCTRQ